MHANEQVDTPVDLTPDLPLAEVLQMPHRELESFYSRNSAALPRLDNGGSGRYDRASLPTPVEAESDSALGRLVALASRSRFTRSARR